MDSKLPGDSLILPSSVLHLDTERCVCTDVQIWAQLGNSGCPQMTHPSLDHPTYQVGVAMRDEIAPSHTLHIREVWTPGEES